MSHEISHSLPYDHGFRTSTPQPSNPPESLVATAAPVERAIAAIWQSDWLIGFPDALRLAAMRAYAPSSVTLEWKDAAGEYNAECAFRSSGQTAPARTARKQDDASPNLCLSNGRDEQGAPRLAVCPGEDRRTGIIPHQL